jgi:methionyl-tRNA formyltransferase
VVAAPRLRVVFFGTPAFAVPTLEALLRSRHEVVAVVSQPDRPKGRGHQLQPTPTKVVAGVHRIPVLQPAKIRDAAFLQAIGDLQPDLGVVVAFGRILPDALLQVPRLGMINLHASLLPRYRGAAPIQRAVLDGETQTGVTIMRVETELDAGPMFSSAAMPIGPDATSGEVEAALAVLGADLLVPVVDALAEDRAVETPQDHARATHAPKITKEEGAIDWTGPAKVIHNRVRGLQPWPLASAHLGGTRYVIRRTLPRSTRNTPSAPNPQASDVPGTVLRAHGDEFVVACGGGSELAVLEIQPEGRRTMTAREFLAGHGHLEGARFDP